MENTTAVTDSRSFSTSTERQNVSPFSLYPSVMGWFLRTGIRLGAPCDTGGLVKYCYYFNVYLFVCLCKRICHGVSVAVREQLVQAGSLCVGPGDPTQAIRLHSKHFYLLSHLASPKAHLEKYEVTAASLGSFWTRSCSWEIQVSCGKPCVGRDKAFWLTALSG